MNKRVLFSFIAAVIAVSYSLPQSIPSTTSNVVDIDKILSEDLAIYTNKSFEILQQDIPAYFASLFSAQMNASATGSDPSATPQRRLARRQLGAIASLGKVFKVGKGVTKAGKGIGKFFTKGGKAGAAAKTGTASGKLAKAGGEATQKAGFFSKVFRPRNLLIGGGVVATGLGLNYALGSPMNAAASVEEQQQILADVQNAVAQATYPVFSDVKMQSALFNAMHSSAQEAIGTTSATLCNADVSALDKLASLIQTRVDAVFTTIQNAILPGIYDGLKTIGQEVPESDLKTLLKQPFDEYEMQLLNVTITDSVKPLRKQYCSQSAGNSAASVAAPQHAVQPAPAVQGMTGNAIPQARPAGPLF